MVRFSEPGGESGDGLAPVTPLFPRGGAQRPHTAVPRPVPQREAAPFAGPGGWNDTWADDPRGGEAEAAGDDGYDGDDGHGDGYDACGEIEREIAEKTLLKKLRTRSLSVREARAVVAERGLDDAAIEGVIGAFLRMGYLDDAKLADQLIHAGVDRKGQGRTVIAQTLAKRGIPRGIADAALDALPDDDARRALEFARTKAGSMSGLDRDVALRRLSGQLARRGYGGSVALQAARTALDEVAQPGRRVRFE